jgi:hypothetical protein
MGNDIGGCGGRSSDKDDAAQGHKNRRSIREHPRAHPQRAAGAGGDPLRRQHSGPILVSSEAHADLPPDFTFSLADLDRLQVGSDAIVAGIDAVKRRVKYGGGDLKTAILVAVAGVAEQESACAAVEAALALGLQTEQLYTVRGAIKTVRGALTPQRTRGCPVVREDRFWKRIALALEAPRTLMPQAMDL